MGCKCKNIKPQSKKAYDQMVTVEIPAHMGEYKNARMKAGLSSKISIDPCILEEVQFLWDNGIITYGVCCGHNKCESFVNVDIKCVRKMVKMGYRMNHKDPERCDTFCLNGVEAKRSNDASGLHLHNVSGSLPPVLREIENAMERWRLGRDEDGETLQIINDILMKNGMLKWFKRQ